EAFLLACGKTPQPRSGRLESYQFRKLYLADLANHAGDAQIQALHGVAGVIQSVKTLDVDAQSGFLDLSVELGYRQILFREQLLKTGIGMWHLLTLQAALYHLAGRTQRLTGQLPTCDLQSGITAFVNFEAALCSGGLALSSLPVLAQPLA